MVTLQTALAPRFSLGRVVATPGAHDALNHANLEPLRLLRRHVNGDWGDCCEEDAQANERALLDGSRIFSVYHTAAGEKIWLITEADRSYSTFLLPEEY